MSDRITAADPVPAPEERVYCLTVADDHTLTANGIFTGQCDGDEDCIMLLLDGLINFSRSFLPQNRGGSMDAPLVLTSRIDPVRDRQGSPERRCLRPLPDRGLHECPRCMQSPKPLSNSSTGWRTGSGPPRSGRRVPVHARHLGYLVGPARIHVHPDEDDDRQARSGTGACREDPGS